MDLMGRVLVTGGAGFIGAHLVDCLVERGCEVIVLDNLRRGTKAKLREHMRRGRVFLVEGDVRRYDAVAQVIRDCAVVYHLAAQSSVMSAVQDPEYCITTNVLGTFNVLRGAAAAGVRSVVFASSREVYGEPARIPVAEDHPLRPKNQYGASKVFGETYCRMFAVHGVSARILRLANVYGPGDRDRVLPTWLRNAQRGEDLQVYGGSN